MQLLDTSGHVETQLLPYDRSAVSAVCYVIAASWNRHGLCRVDLYLYVVLRFFKRREGSYVVDEAQAIMTATARVKKYYL